MPGALATLDLNRLPVDEKGFLDRVLELGLRLGRFPGSFLEALSAYLQAEALHHAGRFRTGLRVSKEDLGRGMRRAALCLDAGLKEEARGDLNAGLELLRPDRFQPLRQRGWEILYKRLELMRGEAGRIMGAPWRGLLKGSGKRLRRWRTIRAEDCTIEDPEGQRSEMDLVAEFAEFERVAWQARFLGSLPWSLLRRLSDISGRSWGFDQVVMHVVKSLATDNLDLLLDDDAEDRLRDLCEKGGTLRPEARHRVEHLLRGHLLASSPDQDYIDFVLEACCKAMGERVVSAEAGT